MWSWTWTSALWAVYYLMDDLLAEMGNKGEKEMAARETIHIPPEAVSIVG